MPNDTPDAELFDGSGDMFRRIVPGHAVYGEYGVGLSTDWVYANTAARILAVDTSPEWAASVLADKDPARIDLALVDVGPVREWGWPVSYAKRMNFDSYCTSIWRRPEKPDVVLIDGRFRVCCFLTCVLEGGKGLKILFDDYEQRPHYHIAEEILPVVDRFGRQAMFELDGTEDRGKAADLRSQFRLVMD